MTVQELFIKYFKEELTKVKNARTAYRRASDRWESDKGCKPPYSGYDSLRVTIAKTEK